MSMDCGEKAKGASARSPITFPHKLTPLTMLAVVTVLPCLALPTQAQARPVGEDAALNILLETLKRDRVYRHRISFECISFSTEAITGTYFQFVLRENHTPKCGGDPDIMPSLDRYRVFRGSRKIEWLNRIEDQWERYNPAHIR